jgi:ComEC/Rec2-related protein
MQPTVHTAVRRGNARVMLPPLLPISAAILLGAALGPTHPGAWQAMLILALCALPPALFVRSGGAWMTAGVLFGLALGLWRATPVSPGTVQWPGDAVDAVSGTVLTWPVVRGELVRTNMRVLAARTAHGWEPARATLSTLVPSYPPLARGDAIVVGGSPALRSAGAPDRDGSLYGQWVRVGATDPATTADSRRHALQTRLIAGIDANIREPEAGFAAGVLLGSHSTVDDATLAALNSTGTTQHIVISGWNIALIVGMLAALGRAVGIRRRGVWLGISLVGIVGYTFLVGADASVVRAAIMGAGGLIAPALGRRSDPILWLSLAMAGMALHDPGIVTDLSFLLSCAATFGVLVVAPVLAQWARRYTVPARYGGLTEILAMAVSAQLLTEPLIAHQFGRVSLISPIVNTIVEPLVPAIMACAAATGFLSLVHVAFAASIAGIATAAPAWLFLKIVKTAAALPGASLTLPQPGVALTVLWYAIPASIACFVTYVRPQVRIWRMTVHPREAAACALGFVLVAALSIGLAARFG